jgi:O-antigen ligase
MIASLNRGLWLTLGLVLAYGAVRQAVRHDWRPLGALFGGIGVVIVLLVATPLGGSVTARLSDVSNSNDSRSEVYQLAWAGALQAPLTGHGAPQEVPGSLLPPVGTHGMLWNLMYSYGFLAAGMFLLWLIVEIFRSAPSRSPGSLWLHLMLLIGLLQLPIYGLIPQVVLLGIAAGLARREAAAYRTSVREADASRSASQLSTPLGTTPAPMSATFSNSAIGNSATTQRSVTA